MTVDCFVDSALPHVVASVPVSVRAACLILLPLFGATAMAMAMAMAMAGGIDFSLRPRYVL